MKKIIAFWAAVAMCATAYAAQVKVDTLRYAGEFALVQPVMIDSVDTGCRAMDVTKQLSASLRLDAVEKGKLLSDGCIVTTSKHGALHLMGFALYVPNRSEVTIDVKGLKHKEVYVDGEKIAESGKTTLDALWHKVVIKTLATAAGTDTVSVSVDGGKTEVRVADIAANHLRSYGLLDVLHASRYYGASLSADGRYLSYGVTITRAGGNRSWQTYIKDLTTGNIVARLADNVHWMPRTCAYYITRTGISGARQLVTVDPHTGTEKVLVDNLPEGSFTVAPGEDFLIFTTTENGPADDKSVYQIIEPDDRQPGWRSRSGLMKYDIATGLSTPLTFGHHDVSLNDISNDGKRLLVSVHSTCLTQRPTSLSTIMVLNLDDMSTDTICANDGFVSNAQFSPDGKSAVVTGSPEAFGGIGKNVAEGQIPNMYDIQLFVVSLADMKVRAMTRNFNPSIQQVAWSNHDGMIYFTAEDRDYVNMFAMNPRSGAIRRIDLPEETVGGFSLANASSRVAFYGQSASNSDRLYTMEAGKWRTTVADDLSRQTLDGIALGECRAWNYINEQGDTISCRYYLPANFDANAKWPMIVNYYGGCSPTSRYFESRYPQHAYASQGYVVLVINPRGASGFGQKHSAWHVNTAGEGVADDIIGATRQFCREHAFVNDKKIGCIGASYGGFMTQYLQTRTDLFAAAISHAGISDHTSYWGEGYWGYSYSEVSMAGNYPWTNRHLFVDQSPLFNADKIHTPLLFVHGTSDNNVPVGESIQMYTALKLLGRETALVLVEGEDHHITDYHKRIKWHNTIMAWFAKWLKDDASWWNQMYGGKSL